MTDINRRQWMKTFCLAAPWLAGTAAAAPFDRSRLPSNPIVLERGFANVPFGQLHFRHAYPKDPAAAARRPVVCFHQTPNGSQVYVEFMAELATDRHVYAVDTPGHGESDLPLQPPEIEDYAQAMAGFVATRQLKDFDVVGYHTGASIAAVLANQLPAGHVHRMLLAGLALFTAEERQQFFQLPWPKPTSADGSHLIDEWQRSHRWRGQGQSDESVRRTFVQKLLAGDQAWWGARAVMRHDLAGTLKASKVPIMALNSSDDLVQITPRVASIRPDIAVKTLENMGFGMFEAYPKLLANLARSWFDQAGRAG